MKFFPLFLISVNIFLVSCSLIDSQLGIFTSNGDIGKVVNTGSVEYNAEQKSYLITGGGENMWFDKDAFHFVWKEASRDIFMAADIQWIGTGGNPHRKACLIIRQNLEGDSPYVDAVIHGDGLTSMQYREEKGGLTREIQSNVSGPNRIQIEKEGNYVSMSIAGEGETLHSAGGTFKILFNEPFYIGLGVCAHDSTVLEKAVFSNVEIKTGITVKKGEAVLESTLETIAIASKDRRVIYHKRQHFEAPNWTQDGKHLIFNSNGQLYKIPVSGGEPELINTEFVNRCNNDHGISPDGTQLVISDQSKDDISRIYTLPITGGIPKLITPDGPSYWHGWSPDGKTLAFVGQRNNEYDIYSIPVSGGKEKRLTSAPGLDDGPDYTPDGKYIYFNSVRTDTMQIWRMNLDGSDERQITFDEYNDWFPHPSPDGKWIAFVSYENDIQGHPANKDVMLRIMSMESGEIEILAKLFGGQGTINVPSWSPDSDNLAFVSYRLVYPD